MFNENNFITEVNEYCQDYLSYLLDDNQNLEIIISRYIKEYTIYKFFLRTKMPFNSSFYWNNIKDEFIPFLEMFNKRYDIINEDGIIPFIYFLYKDDNNIYYYSFNEILNMNIEKEIKLIYFYFKIK